jgi:hypothetical protein
VAIIQLAFDRRWQDMHRLAGRSAPCCVRSRANSERIAGWGRAPATFAVQTKESTAISPGATWRTCPLSAVIMRRRRGCVETHWRRVLVIVKSSRSSSTEHGILHLPARVDLAANCASTYAADDGSNAYNGFAAATL